MRFDPADFGVIPNQDIYFNVYTVTPYAAYVINPNLFLTLLAGYETQDFEKVLGVNLDSQGGFYDGNVNLIGKLGSAEVKSKLGFRHEISKINGVSASQFFTTTASLDVGLPVDSATPYLRVWYEAFFDDSSAPAEHVGCVGALELSGKHLE